MRRLLLISTLALVLAAPALGKPPHHKHEEVRAFSELERHLIVEYYQSQRARPSGLPPGIAKKVARGGAVPPGLARQRLPRELEGRLPPVPRGYERVVVDGRVVLVEIASQVVHDVLTDIIVGR
jgi:hypothetical protein